MSRSPGPLLKIALAGASAFAGGWVVNHFDIGSAQAGSDRSSERYFAGCDEARAAGVAPIYVGQPGYREGMDGDGDGIACEPYHGQ